MGIDKTWVPMVDTGPLFLCIYGIPDAAARAPGAIFQFVQHSFCIFMVVWVALDCCFCYRKDKGELLGGSGWML